MGEVASLPDAINSARPRALELLARGVSRARWDKRKARWVDDLWWHEPGALPWWEARQRIGGRVDASTLRASVEGLVADGLLIEAWLEAPGHRTASHVLLLPGHSKALRRPIVRARATDEVLAGEPWAAALAGGGRDAIEGKERAKDG